ncbi:riboflavin transporter MCH5 [Tricladium varicosporioides]|nr:riboflavin transporter MCH5 [Hymenoscyphus varicosporioides]
MSSHELNPDDHNYPTEENSTEKQDNFQTPKPQNLTDFKAEEVTFPEGGMRAWIVAIGASLTIFTTFGWVNSWGVFQEYYESHQLQHMSTSAISWIGSLQSFILFSGALFGGPLFDKYGERVIWLSAPTYLLSVFLTSICKEYYQFMLAQGILGGLGMGFTMSCCFTATSHYFNKNRGAALGMTVAGSSLGGVIWPIVLNKLFHSSISFGWSIRICAFAMLGLLLSAAGIKARLPPRKGAFFILNAFTEPEYVSIVLSVFFSTVGFFIPIFYLPSYAVMRGMSTRLAFYLVSVLNGASFFGRVIPGITADKLGPLNMLFVSTLSTGILILCWPKTKSNVSIFVFAGLYGFFSGAIISLMSVALSRIPKDPRQIGTYMGMGMFVIAIGALIGPPINGALITKFHEFDQAAIFSGVLVLVGGVILIPAKLVTGKGLFANI